MADLQFYVLFNLVFQSDQDDPDDWRMIMKGCVQWNPV